MPEDLTNFIEEVTGDSHLRVEDDLGDGFVRLRSAEAERRQAKHDIRGSEDIIIEMLRNARDAHAHTIFVAVGREENTRRIVMIDDGDGVPAHMRDKIFEARVTSKLDTMHFDTWGVHGRGMALYAITVNAKDAHVQAGAPGKGTSIVVETDLSELSEKTDQSSMPVFSLSDAGTVIVRGPRNINRTVAEFSYIDRETCTVYFGSQTEVAATLWHYGRELLPKSTIAFCTDASTLPVCKRLGIASTPEEFCELADDLGLVLSTRSARRIMDGEIACLDPLAESIDPYTRADSAKTADDGTARKALRGTSQAKDVRAATTAVDARGLKIAPDDMNAFESAVTEAYRDLADAYYLDGSVHPEITVRKDMLNISVPVRRIR